MKTIIANWREILIGLLTFAIVTFLLSALGSDQVSDSPVLNLVVTGLTVIATGVLRFIACLVCAWFGLWTWARAARTVFSSDFDNWWNTLPVPERCKLSLIAVAVLAVVAGICMAA